MKGQEKDIFTKTDYTPARSDRNQPRQHIKQNKSGNEERDPTPCSVILKNY